ncbi:BTAD domain-containing putative transcriptional regulator [Nonomuraea sp. NPDC049419]|uniref:AfsR/SARP family transcriptional regulator n=1 Tax=Nonomuraea sp. NPDC049419 TaxID=3155772 RepID=UPI00342B1C34
MLELGVLGPLSVRRGGTAVHLGAGMVRRVLAVLLVRAGQPVGAAELLDELWGQAPPATARKTLQTYVHRLRKDLGDERLIRHGPAGYSLSMDAVRTDAEQFTDLVDRARLAHRHGDAAHARDIYEQALHLWRGTPFEGIEAGPTLSDEIGRLQERRLTALEERVVLDLALGRHTEVIGELDVLVRAHPYRESLRAHLMLALYRSDRQAEALEQFQLARAVLRDELGIDPCASLRQLYEAILRCDPSLHRPGIPPAAQQTAQQTAQQAVVVPRQLPVSMGRFTGREGYLRDLDDLLSQPGAVVISAIAGTAGVGKTALAVHWAHRVAERFPDGQIYLNLRGYAPSAPMRPIEALSVLLRALGLPAEQVPVDLAEAEARYRTLAAGRRLLIVLDNARSSSQARPLLPGTGDSLVLITSRDRLTGLVAHHGVHRLILDAMTGQEAEDLLVGFLGRDRVQAEPSACAALIEVCAHLPLALCIAGARLADQPHAGIGQFVQDLIAGDTLASLTVEDDEHPGVRAAFDLSYRALTADEQRVFRRLGLVPCGDFTPPVAAALADLPPARAAQILRRLTAAHLTTEERPGRFSLHDLLRRYAAAQSEQEDGDEDRAAAVTRLLEWYLHQVTTADHRIRGTKPPPGPADSPGPPDHSSALDWVTGERHNIVKVIDFALRHGHHDTIVLLADRLRGYYGLRPDKAEWLTIARSALAAARTGRDPALQRTALNGLAQVSFSLGRLPRAIAYLRQAIALADDTVTTVQRGHMLCNLGHLLGTVGRTEEAAATLRQAHDLYADVGDEAERAGVLLNLANLHRDGGHLHEALRLAEESVLLHRRFDDPVWEALSIATAGEVSHLLGRYDAAVGHLDRALAMHRERGNQRSEAELLCSLGRAHLDRGGTDLARRSFETALHLAREVDHRTAEAQALHGLALLSTGDGALPRAIALHREALAIAGDTGALYLTCEARLGLAEAHLRGGRLAEAMTCARQAVTLAEQSRFRVLSGRAVHLLARCCAAGDLLEQARGHAFHALDVHRGTGHRPGLLSTHTFLAELLGDDEGGEHAEAARSLHADLYGKRSQ